MKGPLQIEDPDMRRLLDAARCIRRWHDTIHGGMVVGGDDVRRLWEAVDLIDGNPSLHKLGKMHGDNAQQVYDAAHSITPPHLRWNRSQSK